MSDSNIYKVHVVAGPTAAGKTSFALNLAREINGELINVDSRQVYRYMDIGTNKGKVKPAGQEELFAINYPLHTLENISMHLLSFLNPDEQLNIYDFRALVYDLIPRITRAGKVPILVGGSGLYLAAILQPDKYKLSTQKFNPEYREKLENMSLAELQALLIYYSQATFEELNESDRQNKRRLIRRLEILNNDGEVHTPFDLNIKLEPDIHFIDLPLPELTEKINQRVIAMFEEGLVDEVRNLLKMGYDPNLPVLQGIGYAQVIEYLQHPDQITLADCIQNVQIAHRQYAKRQLTWFKKYLSV